jgi:hypothetical protein
MSKGTETEMKQHIRVLAAAGGLLTAMFASELAFAQKAGGILKMYTIDSPASMSILEEATVFAERPMMGVFNNLVMFDQHVKQNSLSSIVPDSVHRARGCAREVMNKPGGLSDGIWVPPRCAFIRGPSPRHARGDAVGLSRKPGIAFDNHTLSPICPHRRASPAHPKSG